jgi:DNA-binding transcriptional regulator YdaS (Cro superfamily)
MGHDHNIDSAFAKAIKAIGSQSAYARFTGRGQASVSERLKSGKPIWDVDVLKVEAETGISRHELRPDLYPRDLPPFLAESPKPEGSAE